MRCITCGYRLRDLEDNRCPECGRAFDPDDPTTTDANEAPSFPMLLALIWLCIPGAMFLAARVVSDHTLFAIVVSFAVPIVLSIVISAIWYRKRRKFRD